MPELTNCDVCGIDPVEVKFCPVCGVDVCESCAVDGPHDVMHELAAAGHEAGQARREERSTDGQ